MGTAAQLGLVEESTYGTYVAPTRFFEFVNESLVTDIARIESQGWRAGQRVLRTGRWRAGRKLISGEISLELQNKSMGLLFKHALGAIATTTPGGGTNTRDHTATLGDLRGKSTTIQVGRDDRGGTVRPFSYLGCKIRTWEISCEINQFGMLTLGILARDETTAQSLATASYAAGIELFTFVEGSLTIAAGSTPVRSATISGDNGLPDDDFALGSNLMREPLEPALRTITGELDADFSDLTAYNRFVNGTEATLVLDFTGSLIEGSLNYGVQVTANVRFDGTTPTVENPQEIRQPLPFKVIAPAAGDPISIRYRTIDTSP
jgi:hypothetical protein